MLLGGRVNGGWPPIPQMLVDSDSSFSTCSRNSVTNLGRESRVDLIPLACWRRQRGARRSAVVNPSESGGKTEECVLRFPECVENGILERRATTAMGFDQAAQLAVNLNSNLSAHSGNVVHGLSVEEPVDPIQFTSGGAGIKARRSCGENATVDRDETIREAGFNRSSKGNMGRRTALLLGGSSLWTSLGCCRRCEEAAAAQDWSYDGSCGSAEWEGLCTSGTKQSPVDITSSNTEGDASLGMLDFVYVSGAPSIRNTGHGTIQVSFANANNFVKVKGQTLQLLQFHFHAPSEHAFNGEHYAMEAHLVHRDLVTRKLAVVGVMLDASKFAVPNKCLAASLAYVPQEHGQSVDAPMQISPSLLLPPSYGKNGSRGYVHYDGSLTTPPCSESVEWFVLDKPLKIPTSQVLDFMCFSGDRHSMAFNSVAGFDPEPIVNFGRDLCSHWVTAPSSKALEHSKVSSIVQAP